MGRFDDFKAHVHYRIKHWGDGGEGRIVTAEAADPCTAGTLYKLGNLRQVRYQTTKKGDPPGAVYEHDFLAPYPILAATPSGLLVIAGGGYRVGTRGIIG